jgi:hypothetical protein
MVSYAFFACGLVVFFMPRYADAHMRVYSNALWHFPSCPSILRWTIAALFPPGACQSSRAASLVLIASEKIWLVLPCLRLTYGFAPPAPRRMPPITWFVARAVKTGPPRVHLFAGVARLLLPRTIPSPLLYRGPGGLLHWPVVLGP